MTHRQSNLVVYVGLVLSLTVHALVLLPIFVESLSTTRSLELAQARFTPDQFEHAEPPPTAPDETPLGIDADTPSSFTWIGYDEYKTHIAALADLDQAAFTEQSAPAAPVETPVDPAPETETPDTVSPAEDVAPAEPNETDLEPDNIEPATIEREAVATIPVPPEHLVALRALNDTMRQLLTPPVAREAVDKAAAPETPRPDATGAQPQPAVDAPPAEPRPVQPLAPKPTDAGAPSDRESDETSVIEALPENWRSGQPLAAPGLEIQTRRPVFTVLQTLTGVAANPLFRIHFGRDGKPNRVEMLESSGNGQIDAVVEASLYRWRAMEGERLKKLKAGETTPVTIRIVMRRR